MFGVNCFVQLVDNVDSARFHVNLNKVAPKYMGDFKLAFTPLTEIHLMKSIGWHKVSDPQYAYILGGIALLILVIACINYISLALTTSASRRKEVGVRKVTGADRKQLVYQFGFESLLLACISMFIGVMFVILFLPSFNQFTQKTIVIAWKDWAELLSIGACTYFCCRASGRKLSVSFFIALSACNGFERTFYFSTSGRLHQTTCGAAILFVSKSYYLFCDYVSSNEICGYKRPWLQ